VERRSGRGLLSDTIVAVITVVGSLNQDIVARVPRHPRPGETVLGSGHFVAAGGKGANQAVAAARLGQSVAMVGRVGDDDAGRSLLAGLSADGVDTSGVQTDPEAGTGLALITLDDHAENAIVVSPGANGRVAAGDVDAAADRVCDAAVLLVQLEIPVEAVARAVEIAQGTVVLNPAPARPLPNDLLARVDVLIPNRSELAVLAGGPEPSTFAAVAAAASALRGPRAVVVTLGADGALVVDGDGEPITVPAPIIEPVDTVGAGDAFCGAMADALARGGDLVAACRWAVNAGAVAATRRGAQPSLPTAAEVAAMAGRGIPRTE
jgi:ribokinase